MPTIGLIVPLPSGHLSPSKLAFNILLSGILSGSFK
jgi:hypothetical protein